MKIKIQIINLIGKHTSLVVFCVVLVIGVVFSMHQYETVYQNAQSLGHTVADLLDADKMVRYATTLEKDEAYNKTKEDLQQLKSHFPDCVDMYVFVLNDENIMTYIYDIYTESELENKMLLIGDLGTVEQIEEEHREMVRKNFREGEESGKLDLILFGKYGSLAGYYVPITASDGTNVYIGIDYSIADFVNLIGWMLVNIFILLVGIALVTSYFEIQKIRKKIVNPIENMSIKATAFANSNHNGDSRAYHIETKENSENELDILARDMNKMMDDIDSYIKNIKTITAERERIGTELKLAERIQKSSLPSKFPAFPQREEFDLYALMHPAKEVGGDFYDFFLIDDNHLALVIADVAGKGIGAALFMMISKVLLNDQAMVTSSPAEILKAVNTRLYEHNEAEMFVTVWLGILEIDTGILTCANAGHEYPAIKRANGEFELFKDKHGFVLGGMPKLRYKDYEIKLEKDDILFVYTDGVSEATNSENELFGLDRIVSSLNTHKEENVKDILNGVLDDIGSFVKEAEQFDDITMLGMQYKGKRMKEKVFRASIDTLDEAQAFVEEELENLDCPFPFIMKYSICLEEMFVNVAHYAYPNKDGDVTIRIDSENGMISVALIDQGTPFNPLEKRDPDVTLSIDQRDIGGLGIFMVKKSMDEVSYEYKNNSNIFTMKKKIA